MKDPFEKIYEPQEDSSLLLKHSIEQIKLLDKSNLNICEVGVGSGFVISNIAKQYNNNNYFGTDINPDAIKYTKQQFKKIEQTITIKQTNILQNIKPKFDLILFNTPYLPCEDEDNYEELTLKDKAIYGGKYGYEVIEQFIYQINDKLQDNGAVLMLYSSQSNHEYITKLLEQNFFEHEILEEETIFFETLYILKITKSKILKNITKNNITNIKYLSSGKHSIVLEGLYKNKPVIIKIGKEQHLQKEAAFTKKLQTENFAPKLYFIQKNFVIREKFEGAQLKDWILTSKKKETLEVLQKIIDITQRLDKLEINKFEMTNPYKHIFIEKDNHIKFIDFERCIFTPNPKNTTQFLQYIRRQTNILKQKGIEIDENKIMEISKKYKQHNFKVNIKDLQK